MALVLLGAEDEGQRWQLRFSWARLPGVPGVQVLRAFYGQEILLALFWDRCGSPPHDLFPAVLYGASPRPGAPPQTLGPGRGPQPSRSLPGAAARVDPSDPALRSCCSLVTMSPSSHHPRRDHHKGQSRLFVRVLRCLPGQVTPSRLCGPSARQVCVTHSGTSGRPVQRAGGPQSTGRQLHVARGKGAGRAGPVARLASRRPGQVSSWQSGAILRFLGEIRPLFHSEQQSWLPRELRARLFSDGTPQPPTPAHMCSVLRHGHPAPTPTPVGTAPPPAGSTGPTEGAHPIPPAPAPRDSRRWPPCTAPRVSHTHRPAPPPMTA